MRSVPVRSSRYAYAFISFTVVLLLGFFVSGSLTLREVDASRQRYEELIRDWYQLRIAIAEQSVSPDPPPELADFSRNIRELLSSESLQGAARLSEPLATARERISRQWDELGEVLRRDVFSPDGTTRARAVDLDEVLATFQGTLFGLERAHESIIALQRRSLEILLVFLGLTILAMIGVFLLIERENQRERLAASEVESLAHGTIGAQERERARISRALHDTLAQELSVALLELNELAAAPAADLVTRMRGRLRSAVEWTRHLAHELHPSEIEQIGLAAAIASYCRDLTATSRVPIEWDVDDDACDVSREIAINIYRIAQEAVTNAIRHGHPSHVEVRLRVDERAVSLSVRDDGSGFDGCGRGHVRGIGLVGMEQRTAMLGGTIRVASSPGNGTHVELEVPRSATGCEESA
ncbi:MAG: sensor histidine kinase [Spirochaetota bacterium]